MKLLEVRSIKAIIASGLFTLAMFTCVLYTSCKNKCGSVVCQNGGTCSNNACVCPTGYFGNTCSSSETAQYVGTYECKKERCLPAIVGATSWESSVVVSATNGGYTVTINDFGGLGTAIDATVDSLNNIYIIPTTGTYGISARGTYSVDSTGHGVIIMTYSESTSTGTGNYQCSMKMTKK